MIDILKKKELFLKKFRKHKTFFCRHISSFFNARTSRLTTTKTFDKIWLGNSQYCTLLFDRNTLWYKCGYIYIIGICALFFNLEKYLNRK